MSPLPHRNERSRSRLKDNGRQPKRPPFESGGLGDVTLQFCYRFVFLAIRGTIFSGTNLTGVIGLETCRHTFPSTLDHRILETFNPLPIPFLRGVGLPERLIEFLPTLLNQAIQYFSCFISYSTKDQDFADRIHADLQNKGVRCWFAPHDFPIGGKILDEIDAAIRLRDKVLLIVSEHSIESDWVEDEVTKAFEEACLLLDSSPDLTPLPS
jgi:hypothetical protein